MKKKPAKRITKKELAERAKRLRQARPKREPRSTIISFRLRDSEAALLQKDLEDNPASGVKSLKQLARMVTIDYSQGKLVYIDPFERRINPDERRHVFCLPPDCHMTDRSFIKALREFLRVEENWRKLRLFILRSGWPADLLEAHRQASTDQERLVVAQKALTRMLKNL